MIRLCWTQPGWSMTCRPELSRASHSCRIADPQGMDVPPPGGAPLSSMSSTYRYLPGPGTSVVGGLPAATAARASSTAPAWFSRTGCEGDGDGPGTVDGRGGNVLGAPPPASVPCGPREPPTSVTKVRPAATTAAVATAASALRRGTIHVVCRRASARMSAGPGAL